MIQAGDRSRGSTFDKSRTVGNDRPVRLFPGIVLVLGLVAACGGSTSDTPRTADAESGTTTAVASGSPASDTLAEPEEPGATVPEAATGSTTTSASVSTTEAVATTTSVSATTTSVAATTTTSSADLVVTPEAGRPELDISSSFACIGAALGQQAAFELNQRPATSGEMALIDHCPEPTHDMACVDGALGMQVTDQLLAGRHEPTSEELEQVRHCLLSAAPELDSGAAGEAGANRVDIAPSDSDQAFGDTAPDQDWDYPDDGQGPADQSGPPCLRGDHGDALGPECNVPLPTLGPRITRGELVDIRGDQPAYVTPTTSDCEVVEGGQCAELRWEPVAPLLAGDFTSIQIAPTDPNIIYAGIDSNDMSLYKSVNGGASWQVTHVTGHTSGVAISPTDPDTVIYTNLEAPTQHTTDGGATWSAVMGGISQKPYTTVSFSPSDSNVAYTANVPGPSRGGMW
ncbi:MAG: hypothetical protein OSB03_19880, partial [Vicinamibacterales bacterium]|nr:hypothetical protein [Vicinamibacterales bacterium]